jgi:hypothetical protein
MNGKRLAFIYADRKKVDDFYQLKTGLFEAFKYLPKNFDVRVFVLSDQMNVHQYGSYDIYFRNTYKALQYAVKDVFEPTHTFIIGNGASNFDELPINKKKPNYLIHKGSSHDKSLSSLFDKVIVEIPEDAEEYSNSIYKMVVNTDIYKPLDMGKYFTVCYPQSLVATPDLDLFNKARVFGSISANLDTTVKIPLNSSLVRQTIFNQSKAVVLLNEDDSVETALSALACNVPVVATKDIKASYVPGVVTSTATVPDLPNITLKALNMRYNFRDAYIIPNFQPQSYAKMIVELTK